MSSLALLAHETSKAPPAFNGLFYATVATIIPVLFLALAVQGRIYGDLLTVAGQTFSRSIRIAQERRPRNLLFAWALAMAWYVLWGFAAAIVIFSVWGEIDAIVSLYRQHPFGSDSYPLEATLFLVVAVAVVPALALGRGFVSALTHLIEPTTPGVTEADSPEPAATPSEPPPAEPGKTGTP